jgi:hypothetical protein
MEPNPYEAPRAIDEGKPSESSNDAALVGLVLGWIVIAGALVWLMA